MEWILNLFQNNLIAQLLGALLAIGGIGKAMAKYGVKFLPFLKLLVSLGQDGIDFINWFNDAYSDRSFTKEEVKAGRDIFNRLFDSVMTRGTAAKKADELITNN